jgi:hypothetical protein
MEELCLDFLLYLHGGVPHYFLLLMKDCVCSLVVRVDSRRYHIFWEVVGLERGPLSLMLITEELLEWKSSGSGSRKSRLTAVGIRCGDHATPSIRKFDTNFADMRYEFVFSINGVMSVLYLIEIRPLVYELKHGDTHMLTSHAHRSRNILTDSCLWGTYSALQRKRLLFSNYFLSSLIAMF